jgi:DNA-binding response OmpR family regulator
MVMGKPIIVVVDDQPFVCEMVTKILSGSYEVHAFTSGKDVLKYIDGNVADLFLLDYDMPGMTGYEVLMSVRANKHNEQKPAVFLTAQTNDRMKEEMLERGANDYLCKPINAINLMNCVKEHLSK